MRSCLALHIRRCMIDTVQGVGFGLMFQFRLKAQALRSRVSIPRLIRRSKDPDGFEGERGEH